MDKDKTKKEILTEKTKNMKKKTDEVRVASRSSFPASDSPAYWASAPKDESESKESKKESQDS